MFSICHAQLLSVWLVLISHETIVQRYSFIGSSTRNSRYHCLKVNWGKSQKKVAMFGFGEGHGDRIEALEGWKKDTEPWGSRIDILENWKSSADTSLKNLEGSHNEISSWQTEVDKWRATTDGKLGRIERKKLDVSDYEKERDQRDEKHRRLRESCDAAFPAMERRMHTVEKEVARLGERTGDIEKAVHKWKGEKFDEGGKNGSVSISGGDPRGNIYMIQQQGYQFVPDIP